ncbi:hypothetical protein Indivirus_6_33 [Indivirus ILV1]|uniref:Uncharacterized protein n=1 Tax=Indivirus ILV1 TaxID=1977633 RepID=A0A1V0SE23_9VIRU|nr:hypothetical protein Indivirus_6_33 [Indivirus ILV1]
MYVYLYIILLVILLTSIESCSQYNLKIFNKSQNIQYFILGSLGYVIISAILSYLFGFEKMGIVNNLWNVFSSISIVLIGYLFFKEKLSTIQTIGVILGVIGIGLMGIDGYMNHKD